MAAVSVINLTCWMCTFIFVSACLSLRSSHFPSLTHLSLSLSLSLPHLSLSLCRINRR